MKLWKISITVQSGFCTSGEKMGSFIDGLKDAHNLPYIPATHIKGIMRCEAERLLRSDPKSKTRECSIFGESDNSGTSSNPRLCKEVLQRDGDFGCDICRLFGPPNVADTTNSGSKTVYQEGLIRVTDFHLGDPQTEDRRMDRRPHVAINRSSQTKETGHIFSGNVVPGGVTFQGFIIVRKDLQKSEEKLLEASLHSLAHYGIGGNRSRGLGGVLVNIDTNCTVVDYQAAVTKRFDALQEIRNK